MLINAKNLINISLNKILELDVKLLNIFSQKTFFIKDIVWNLKKVNKNTITLELNYKKILNN